MVRLTGESYTPVFPRHTSHYDGIRMFALRRDKELLDQAILERARAMFADGLVEETRALIDVGLRHGETARKATGYAEAIAVIDGQMDVDSAIESVAFATRRLAKKQRTWFRRDPRIHWLDVSDGDEIPQLADRIADIVAGAK